MECWDFVRGGLRRVRLWLGSWGFGPGFVGGRGEGGIHVGITGVGNRCFGCLGFSGCRDVKMEGLLLVHDGESCRKLWVGSRRSVMYVLLFFVVLVQCIVETMSW